MAKNPLIRRKERSYSIPLPNQSAGILDDYAVRKVISTKEGTITRAPINGNDIVNKTYADSIISGGAPEGTEVLSTGEAGGVKYLREDGDGTSSWQAVAGGGDVTAAANIGDNLLVRGDGAVKGVQNSGITISDTDQITGVLDLTLTGDLTIPDEGLKDATNTSASFFVNNGTNYVPVVMSGEATMAADGSVTLLGGDAASVIQIAKVNEGGGISKGQIVYISGATGGFPQVSLASNDDYVKSEVLAIANETKSDTQTIIVTLLGEFTGLNTSTFTEGQILYLGTSGNITSTHPTGLNAVVRIGKAIKINVSTGTLIFNPDPLIAIASVDGFVRTQIVNTNTGTSAIVNTTYVNDAGHYLSINMQGSNNTFGSSEASMYNLGYGNTKYIVDGNKDHVFYTDVSDAHDGSSFTEKMRLSAAGNLTLSGTVDGIDIATDVAANTSASHAESHTILSHSDTTATGAELDTLTGGGDTTLHDHDGISENTSARHTQGTDTALGSGAVAADHGTAATDQIVNVSYGTGAPPTANTTTIGSLFIQYTA